MKQPPESPPPFLDLGTMDDMRAMSVLNANLEWLAERLEIADAVLAKQDDGSRLARDICKAQAKRCALLADVAYAMSARLDVVRGKLVKYRNAVR